ncbi:MAG: 4-hydroxy-tetrahydrodipicolinate reductase [Termitinemataceae bacterium]|nr:MAG: 4-hydroxy-tetrahydrodipicolinate reductase [Termitinemataceae bacterium]
MNILIVGYGKMGKMIESICGDHDCRIVAVLDPHYEENKSISGAPVFRSFEDFDAVRETLPLFADAAVEFTAAKTATVNILALAKRNIPVVVGTTGWYDKLDDISAAVEACGSSLLWSSNFSLGVNLFYKIAEFAAQLADKFPEYDVGGYEVHHNKKIDSPSGTAKTLCEKVLAKMTSKKVAAYDKLDRKPLPDELHYASLRLGNVPGTHTLSFDSSADTIEITHTSRNREGLAGGALTAAKWLASKPHGKIRCGIFTMDDVLSIS